MIGQPDGLAWVERALAQADGAPDRLRAGALVTAGMLTQASLDHHRALLYLQEALALFRRAGGRRTEAFTLLWLGRAAMAADVEGAARRRPLRRAAPPGTRSVTPSVTMPAPSRSGGSTARSICMALPTHPYYDWRGLDRSRSWRGTKEDDVVADGAPGAHS